MRETSLIYEDAARAVNNIPITGFADKTVLLTGCTGLIGMHVLYTLAEIATHIPLKIICPTRHIPSYLTSLDSDSVNFVETDLTCFEKVVSLPKADIVIHTAGYGQPAKFTQQPVSTALLNTSTVAALQSRVLPKGRMLFISTSEIYSGHPGAGDDAPKENEAGRTTPDHPRGIYIEAKRCGEALMHAGNGSYERTMRIGRVALAYGPGAQLSDERVLNQFIKAAIVCKEITLLDSGSAIRTYCYVSDAVEMLLSILMRGKEVVYNIGGDSRLTILELAKQIAAKTSAAWKAPAEDPASSAEAPPVVDMSMSRYNAEFRTNLISLSDGLDRTIEWYRELLR